jgi:hypothetical protein
MALFAPARRRHFARDGKEWEKNWMIEHRRVKT